MNLEKTITHAWQQQSKWLYVLSPLSWAYGVFSKVRKSLYDKGVLKSYRADVPIMVIGNITVGGSGKTPLIISLVDYLQNKGIKVGVISRGYGGDSSQMPALVTLDSTPNMVGDEPCLIVQSNLSNKTNFNITPMAVAPNRQQAVELLLKHHPELELIISDDGLQHYKLQRDIEWIVVDSYRGFGNEQLLPVGFLREPMSRLEGATVVYHELNKSNDETVTCNNNKLIMRLKPSKLEPLLIDLINLPNQLTEFPSDNDSVYAMSGIGYPARFFATLSSLGFEIIEKPYPDHHAFSTHDLRQFINTDKPIIVTSKDAVKLRQLANMEMTDVSAEDIVNLASVFTRIWVLPVNAKLSNDCYQNLDKSLIDLSIL